ncbi:hypothetical protein BG004_004507 [Podila humilis]|nr:hypothetical protein BG004_004507 [Podila humilis]
MWEDFRTAYQHDAVVTDQENVEILAIRAAFPFSKIEYCAWHVLRVWKRRLTYAMLGIDMALSPEQRANERDKQENRHRVEMMQFLDKNYFKETDRQRWMICFRESIACATIDTNNYVESWHNALKMYFLKDKQRMRADMVVYTLVKSVIPFYQYKLATGRLQVGKRSNMIGPFDVASSAHGIREHMVFDF